MTRAKGHETDAALYELLTSHGAMMRVLARHARRCGRLWVSAILVAVALGGCFRGWTKRDTLMEAGTLASFAADWRQTEACVHRANNDSSQIETNPIIGERGQNVSPSGYFLTVGLLHVAIASVLPPKARFAFQAATTAWQVKTVYENHEEFISIRAYQASLAAARK